MTSLMPGSVAFDPSSADGEEFLRTRVVGDMKPRFLLNH